MNQEEIQYLNQFLLKSGERLDLAINENNAPVWEIQIVKQTERTYRVVGLLTLTCNPPNLESSNMGELLSSVTPRKKLHLKENDPNTLKWFQQGLILKEIRFKKDGKTVDSQYFRMGFPLYKYAQEQIQREEDKIENEFSSWKKNISALRSIPTFTPHRERGFFACLSRIKELVKITSKELKESSYFLASWSFAKRMKFLHFICAFLQISFMKEEFDWKEIGAEYFQEIGGSKEFDRYKDEFINLLEAWAGCPVSLMGMTSLGRITPLYFSGHISGSYSTYRYGPVHSLTDIAISIENYTTNSTTLWLVENRAILTRMAAKKNFLHDTESLVLCVDGHLRSSHKHCIKQLLTNGEVAQVLIWTDYDPDGLQIAKEAYLTVSEKYTGTIKWVRHDSEVNTNWHDYETYMESLLNETRMEQEQVLGGVEEWTKWILQ
ncbi:DUF2399 domain-containing protein [Neobacillus sp. M.A.Huq-85]